MNWDDYLIGFARHAALKSKDDSTKVGAAIVGPEKQILATGYNGLPRGVDDSQESRHRRPEKYKWFEHGERNAIYNAARHGVATRDCSLYVTMVPCADCARGIIQAGIREVVVAPEGWFPAEYQRWQADWDVATAMLKEAGVVLRTARCTEQEKTS